MIAESIPWLTLAAAAPLAAAGAACLPLRVATLRGAAIAASGAAFVAAVAAALSWDGSGTAVDSLDPIGRLLGEPVLAVDLLNAPLVAFCALIGFAVHVAAPRASISATGVRRGMAALSLTVAAFACVSDVALAALWSAAMIPVWLDLRARGRAEARLFAIYLGAAAACMVGGVVAIGRGGASIGAALLVVAVVARKGIVPLHSWMPAMFARGSLATSTLFSAPQLGAYAAIRLVVPAASDEALLVMGSLALVTAVYGAGLATVQSDARRAYGALFMSQSALVLIGLDCSSAAGLTGGLLWWLASGLALAGHGVTLWLLEARRGTCSLRQHHGGYERMPGLAVSFLILGLASVGFPGTLGFVGAELLVGGVVESFPHAGYLVLVATGLNAITVVRMYFALFCGRRIDVPGHQRLRAHEYAAVIVLLAAIVAGGVWPRPLVHSRARAAAAILHTR